MSWSTAGSGGARRTCSGRGSARRAAAGAGGGRALCCGRRPTDVFRSCLVAAGVVGVGGGALIVVGATLPSQGLVVVGAAGIAAGLFLALVANVMPARTMPGAM